METDEIFVRRMLSEYHDEITKLLMQYGNMSQDEAKLKQQPIWDMVSDFKTFEDYEILFHEEPYFWVMSLLHGKETPQWYLDPQLWPPPPKS
jgi:hypothetical protein